MSDNFSSIACDLGNQHKCCWLQHLRDLRGGFYMDKIKLEDTLSPFEVREGEELIRVMPKIDCHYIELNDLQKNIICAVNKWLILNSYLLQCYLNKIGINITPKECKYQLKLLSQNNYLQKMEFHLNGTVANCRAYSVGRKGRGWLSAAGKIIRLSGYIDQCGPLQVKKILSANQMIIGMLNAELSNNTGTSQIVKYNEGNKSAKYIFRAYGFINDEKSSYIVEPYRKENHCIDNLKEKLKRMDMVLKHKKGCNIIFGNNLKILIVAENKYQMEGLMEILKRYNYKAFSLAFSYDRAVLEEEEKIFYLNKKSFWKKLLVG